MMKKIIFIVCLIICMAYRSGDVVLIATVLCHPNSFTSDNMGNLYIVSGNQLSKYNNQGLLQKTHSDKTHGDISFVDASNPLKILVYYHDFRLLTFLDNMLSVSGSSILLDNLGILQPLLTCSSYSDGFWVYDQQEFQLMRFDNNLQVSAKSGNIAQLLGIEIKPVFLTEVNNVIYLNDPVNGILIFDRYGTYSKLIPIKKLKSFQVIENNIVYSDSAQIKQYNYKTFEQKTIKSPVINFISVRYEKERMFVQDTMGVKIYEVK